MSKAVGTLIEVRVDTASGWKLVEAVGANRLGVPGIESLLVTMRDLTGRRRWELGRNNDAIFRAVVHNAASLLMLVDHEGVIQAISGAVTRLLGRDPEGLEGTPLLTVASPADRQGLRKALADCQGAGGTSPEPVTVEAAILDAAGMPVPFELTLVDMAQDPTVSGVVVSAHNITKLRAYQKALADLARTDPLTRLPNRTAADETLTDLLERRDRVAVAFVDLDDFKALNDRHGHHFGDQVLVAVAERLRSTVRPTDLVARYGGDEFVVIVHNPAEGAALDERLSGAMCRPISIGALDVVVKASVGVTYTRPSDALTAVLIRADRAMYGSKGGRTQLGAVAGS